MKRTMLAWLLCAVMVVVMLPAPVANAAIEGKVCEIVGGLQYDTLDEALAAVPDNTAATIRLLQTVNYTSTLTIYGSKKITLDLNGFDLNVTADSGAALDVGYGGSLTTTDTGAGADGAMNLQGVTQGIIAHSSGRVDMTGDVTATGDTENHENGTGVEASGSGVSVTVHGSVSGDICGVSADYSARVSVSGSVTAHNMAVTAAAGGQVQVGGDAHCSGTGVSAETNGTVSIAGTVTVDGSGGAGIIASSGSNVTVGALVATAQGIRASEQSQVTVHGDVSVTSPTHDHPAVSAKESSIVTVDGDISGGAYGVIAETSATVTAVDVTSHYLGVRAATGAEVFVRNIVADGTEGGGVNAYLGGQVTVDGTISAGCMMNFGESEGEEIPTTKTGYRTYASDTQPGSYIWIKTEEVLPSVTTDAVDASGITQDSAAVSGSVTAAGTAPVTERGFVFSTSVNPATSDTKVTADGTGTGAFSATLTGLAANTAYHVRAYAISDAGTAYGEDREFTTLTGGGSEPDDPYIFRTITDPSTGISVSGYIHRDAALTVQETVLPPAGTCAACDAIRARMTDSDFITLADKDISLSLGFRGSLSVSIPVGAQYNGKTVTILHCASGTLKIYIATVKEGKATFTVASLSPFAVFADAEKPDDIPMPATGEGTGVYIWLGLSSFAVSGGCLWLLRRKLKRA